MDRKKSSVEKNTANFIKYATFLSIETRLTAGTICRYVVHKLYTLLATLLPRTAHLVTLMDENLVRFNALIEAEGALK